MTNYDNLREQQFGPAAKFSEHKAGEHITYRMGSEVRTGEIIYVQSPTEVVGQHHPLTYVVDSGNGFPDMVWQTDVLENTGEPVLTQCPYCRGQHMSDQVEQCPLKRDKPV